MTIKNMKIKQKKKAEMTITQTLTTILLILGFVILLYLFYKIYETNNTDTEACHTSVVLRATAGYLSPTIAEGAAKEAVPLKCRTKKICFTSGFFGGKCEEFLGEKGITTVKVSDINQLQKYYAEEIFSCWKMMGEGKIDLFSGYTVNTLGLGKIAPTCLICSRIAFDRVNLEKAGIDLSEVNLERYMATHFVPNQNQTYLQYLAGERGLVSLGNNIVLPNEGENAGSTTIVNKDELTSLSKDETTLTKSDAILFMQITAPTHSGSVKEIGSLLFGGTLGSFALAPMATTQALFSLGKTCGTSLQGAGICALIAAIAGVVQQGTVAYNRYVSAGYCGDVSVGEEARNGCSVVRAVTYNYTDIASYCKNIEGIA
jgi:hypothetical protein